MPALGARTRSEPLDLRDHPPAVAPVTVRYVCPICGGAHPRAGHQPGTRRA